MSSRLNNAIIATAMLLSAGVCYWAYTGLLAERAQRLGSVDQPNRLVIKHGGVYRGAWRSDDADVPTILIQTRESVTIEHSIISGRGDLLVSRDGHANLTIRDCVLTGLNPNLPGRRVGRCLVAQFPECLIVDHNNLESTGGIYVQGYTGSLTAPVTLSVTNNRAHNIDGRVSDGQQGYSSVDQHEQFVQFLQLDKVLRVPHVLIAWNQVINEPGNSRVEDNISLYLSSGAPASPIDIHDNFIQGAFPVNPATDSFSGGGIMLGDGAANDAAQDPAFAIAHDNQVIGTSNYGIAISSGHDLRIENNRVIGSGVFQHGQTIASQNVGIYINNAHKLPADRFARNSGKGNLVGWQKKQKHNDWWIPDAAAWVGNTSFTADLELAEQQEWNRWEAKTKAAKQVVGARSLEAPGVK